MLINGVERRDLQLAEMMYVQTLGGLKDGRHIK